MSESSLLAEGVEDIDLEDNALQDLIQEAESLMNDLPLDPAGLTDGVKTDVVDSAVSDPLSQISTDSTTNTKTAPNEASSSIEVASADTRAAINIVGDFSIDDDDDDGLVESVQDINPRRVDLSDDPLRAVEPTLAAPIEQPGLDDHPLSAVSLNETTTPPTSGIKNIAAALTSPTGSTMTNIFNGSSKMGVMKMNMGINMGRGTGAGEAAAAGMDTISKTTSLFASNLASMAQRGMEKVAAATTPVQPVNVMGGPGGMMQGQTTVQSPGTGMNQENTFSNTATPPNSNPSGMGAGATANWNGTNPSGYAQLDKDQKANLLKKHVGDLFEGERVIMFLTNLLHVSDTSGLSFVASQQQYSAQGDHGIMWCCVMTYYQLIFFSTNEDDTNNIEPPVGWDRNCWQTAMPPSMSIRLLKMPLASMDRVEKTVYQVAGSSYMGLVIHGKDCGRIIRFSTPSYADTGRAFDSLNTYAFPGRRNLGYLFAFESKRQEVMNSIKVDPNSGQQSITLPPTPRRFDPMLEYPRLIKRTAITQPPWAIWAGVNSTYQLSQSYPSVLVGPASLDETKPEALSVIRQCSVFRKGQRLPSLTWCSTGGASIWRSSQPKVGLQGNRSPADELYIRHIIESARGANAMAEPSPVYPRNFLEQLTGDYTQSSGTGKTDDWVPEPGCGLKILDLRPRAAAMANRTGGKFESSTVIPCGIMSTV